MSPAAQRKPFGVGLWRILPASHKTTGKEVSVWVFEKKLLDGVKSDSSGRPAAAARDCILEQLKKEVRFAEQTYRLIPQLTSDTGHVALTTSAP